MENWREGEGYFSSLCKSSGNKRLKSCRSVHAFYEHSKLQLRAFALTLLSSRVEQVWFITYAGSSQRAFSIIRMIRSTRFLKQLGNFKIIRHDNPADLPTGTVTLLQPET